MSIVTESFLVDLSREADGLAMSMFMKVGASLKDDHSLVTEADRQIQRLLVERIHGAFPDHAILGEEEGAMPGPSPSTAEFCWAIDPIDGTAAFTAGLSAWAICVGLLRNGRPVGGFLSMPKSRDLFVLVPGGMPALNGVPLGPLKDVVITKNTQIAVQSGSHRKFRITFPGKVRALGSVASQLGYLASGGFAANHVPRCRIWDLAAAMAIVYAVGGVLYTLEGQEFDFRILMNGERAPAEMLACKRGSFSLFRPHFELLPANPPAVHS